MPKTEEADILLRQREDSLVAKMNMFIHLRQDLERVGVFRLANEFTAYCFIQG